MVNCYIHLLPPSQRRRIVICKSADDQPQVKPRIEDRAKPMARKVKKSKMVPTQCVSKYVPHQRPSVTKRSLFRNYPTCKERLCNSNWELCRIHRFLPHRFQPPVEHCGPLLTSAPRCRTTRDDDDDNYENYKRGWTATDASVGMTPM